MTPELVPAYPGVKPVTDETIVRWLELDPPIIEGGSGLATLAWVVPGGFRAYLRLLHSLDDLEGLLPPVDGEHLELGLATLLAPGELCIFLVWDGFGSHDEVEHRVPGVRVRLGRRGFYAYRGPLRSWGVFAPPNWPGPAQTATYWWPESRRWVAVTDIDATWTVIGLTDPADARELVLLVPGARPARLDDPARR